MWENFEVIVSSLSPHNRHIPGPVAVIGVGLIGGSIAKAVRKRFPDVDVIGVGRDSARLAAARDAGVLTHFGTDFSSVRDAAVVVACTPVDRIADDITSASDQVDSKAVLTDAGSVKANICSSVGDTPRFVGAHPLAGSEKTGWENAMADLYEDRLCVVTPTAVCDDDAVETVDQFWQGIGMRTVRMAPSEHDRAVAQTSHLPHIGAAAVARLLESANQVLVASGFRDTTRVAGGDASMWTAIAMANREAISSEMTRIIDDLGRLKSHVVAGHADAVHCWFEEAAAVRLRLDDARLDDLSMSE